MLIKSASFPAGCFGGWPLRWLAALVAGRFSGWLLQWLAGCFSGRPLQWLASCFSGWPLRWLAASSCFILFVLTTLSLASVGVRYHCGDFPGCMVLWDSGLRLKKLDAALPLRPLAGSEPTFPAGRFDRWLAAWTALYFMCRRQPRLGPHYITFIAAAACGLMWPGGRDPRSPPPPTDRLFRYLAATSGTDM